MHFIYHNDKEYRTTRIASTMDFDLYAHEGTYVEGDYLYNVFTDGWCCEHKLHSRLKLSYSKKADCLSVKAREQKFDIDKSTLRRLLVTEACVEDIDNGMRFTIGKYTFFKICDTTEGSLVCLKDIAFCDRFGDTQDFGVSNMLKRLQTETLPKIEKAVGAENVLEFTLSLKHYDNPNKYLDIKTKIGLPTFHMYDNHTHIFRANCTDNTWYLATAYGATQTLRVEGDGRNISTSNPKSRFGARPIFVFKPSFVVKAKGGLL